VRGTLNGVGRRKRVASQSSCPGLTRASTSKPFQLAEKAVADSLTYLEERMVEMPQLPTNVADVMLAQEIRDFVSQQKSPIDFVVKSISDRRGLNSILNAPAFLSGLRMLNGIWFASALVRALHPEQADMEKLQDRAGGRARGRCSN
jgi:hypothetical protein